MIVPLLLISAFCFGFAVGWKSCNVEQQVLEEENDQLKGELEEIKRTVDLD